ncbi:MAG: hypothetical protein AB7O91_01670 [Sphingomonas sp.]
MGLDVIWLHKGAVPLPAGLSADDALARLEGALSEDGVYFYRDASSRLLFEANVLLPRKLFRWPELQPYNRGELTIEPVGGSLVARYRFSLAHLFWFCLIAALAFGCFAAGHPGLEGAKVASLVFGFLYGGNYLIGLMRASWFVASTLHRGETEEYFSLGEKIGCSLILAAIIAAAVWMIRAAHG